MTTWGPIMTLTKQWRYLNLTAHNLRSNFAVVFGTALESSTKTTKLSVCEVFKSFLLLKKSCSFFLLQQRVLYNNQSSRLARKLLHFTL